MLPNLYFSSLKLICVLKNFLTPKKTLNTKLEHEIRKLYPNYYVIFTSNGRSAIYLILQYLRHREKHVYFPKYICTVVEKAILKVGLIPQKTLENSIPCMILYDRHIICDNAQSIDTICRNNFAILSFNKKDIWAELGGAILSKHEIDINLQKLTFRQEVDYVWTFLHTLAYIFLTKNQPLRLNYEYSSCEGPFYGFNNRQISKISLATALVSLPELPKYKKQRTKNYKAFKKWIRQHNDTQLIENPPTYCYIMCKAENVLNMMKILHNLGLQTKMAYALNENTQKSLKPKMIHILNNPRQDFNKILGVQN